MRGGRREGAGRPNADERAARAAEAAEQKREVGPNPWAIAKTASDERDVKRVKE